MDLDYPPAAQAFRAEVRAWLEANLPRDLCGWTLRDPLTPELLERLRGWQRTLADAGFGAVAWPVDHGGRGAGAVEQLVMAEELARLDAPAAVNPIGLTNVAPSIMAFGTSEQRSRHLPAILRGDEIWCQGFSEPDAGSDLASLRTLAEHDGNDTLVVSGTKIWSTLAGYADRCELLVRTDPSSRHHEGLSVLLVDMASTGVEVRPLPTMTGGNEFAEVSFDAVRVPIGDRLGPAGSGWRVAMTTLGFERASVANLFLRTDARLRRVHDAVVRRPGGASATMIDRLCRCHVDTALLRLLALRAITAAARGRAPGPEASLAKLLWVRAEHAIAEAAGAVLGPDAVVGGSPWAADICASPGIAIAGGTTEIQKTILAERVLGLPRDPQP